MISTTTYLLIFCFAYGLGSLSTASMLCSLWSLQDTKKVGSNNPGASNMLRVYGKLPGILTLLGDIAKGFIAIKMAQMFIPSTAAINLACIAVVLGHNYPIIYRFKGGKGVATVLGVFMGLNYYIAMVLILIWAAVVWLSKFASLGSLCAVLTVLVCSFWYLPEHLYAVISIASLVIWAHRLNIVRLWNRTENKLIAK